MHPSHFSTNQELISPVSYTSYEVTQDITNKLFYVIYHWCIAMSLLINAKWEILSEYKSRHEILQRHFSINSTIATFELLNPNRSLVCARMQITFMLPWILGPKLESKEPDHERYWFHSNSGFFWFPGHICLAV